MPKTDRLHTTSANLSTEELKQEDVEDFANKQNWRDVLLQMLKECKLLKINTVDYASLNLKSNSILDIYIEFFLSQVERLMHEGLIKKYRINEGNRPSLKGQLKFSKHISKNIVHQERFYVQYREYDHLNVYNQLLYKTLNILPAINKSRFIADKANRLLLNFPEMPDMSVSASTFDKLFYDRKSERYREVMVICKMLLLNFRPNIARGAENVIAILFDMNKLWEEFVYRRLVKVSSNGIKVERQQQKDFWWNENRQIL